MSGTRCIKNNRVNNSEWLFKSFQAINMGNKHQQQINQAEVAIISAIKGSKEFYGHLFIFAVFLLALLITGKFSHPQTLWLCGGWTLGLAVHGLITFQVFGPFGGRWETQQIENKLGRKL